MNYQTWLWVHGFELFIGTPPFLFCHYFDVLHYFRQEGEIISDGVKDNAVGFAFWAAAYGIMTMWATTLKDTNARRSFARLCSYFYGSWFFFFYPAMSQMRFAPFVIAFYVPVRFLEFLGNFYFGFIADNKQVAHPLTK